MKVAQIWRYPIKSMGGERLNHAHIGSLGIKGDRVVHVEDAHGHVITARTHHRLLGHHATLDASGEPVVGGLLWSDPKVRTDVVDIVGPGARLVHDDRRAIVSTCSPCWSRRMELLRPLDMMAGEELRP